MLLQKMYRSKEENPNKLDKRHFLKANNAMDNNSSDEE